MKKKITRAEIFYLIIAIYTFEYIAIPIATSNEAHMLLTSSIEVSGSSKKPPLEQLETQHCRVFKLEEHNNHI